MDFDKPKVLPKHIPEIISVYPFGEMIECENLGGIPNNTYKVKTDKKIFVVRIYSIGQSSLDHIKIEIEILKHLARQDFISPRSLIGKNRKVLQYWGKYPILATEFIEGQMVEDKPLTSKLAFNIGKLLNTFRESMSTFKPRKIPEGEKFFVKGDEIMSTMDEDLKQRGWKMNVSNVLKQWERSKKKILSNIDKLEVNVIHSDFWPPNLKCKGDEIVGLMDFDDWVYAPVFFEFMVAFLECAMIGGSEIKKEIAVNLFKGYFKTGGKLSQLERELFADVIEAYCALFLVYNIVQAPEFEAANVYLRRLNIFLDKDRKKQFKKEIIEYIELGER